MKELEQIEQEDLDNHLLDIPDAVETELPTPSSKKEKGSFF